MEKGSRQDNRDGYSENMKSEQSDYQLEEEESPQIKLMRKQLFYLRLICAAVIVFLVIFTVAVLPGTIRVLHNLDEISSDLNKIEFGELARDIELNLQKVSDSLDELDVDTLNHAIESLDEVADTLSQTVKPLTNFYGRFGG